MRNAIPKLTLLLLSLPGSAAAQAAAGQTAYPAMAPIARYRSVNPTAEIALARSAAPVSISDHADILVLGTHGYETAVKGDNGFVCLVLRSWAQNYDTAEFWNPKIRAPMCLNPAAARSVIPAYLKRTDWLLGGASRAEMLDRTRAAIAAGEITAPEPGAMCYMLSKDGYIADDAGGHWHPHLMFYLPRSAPGDWGANLPGSPVFADASSLEPFTVFFVPVSKWSDGTPDGGHLSP